MGALSGSLSYARFYVEGDLPPKHRQVFTEAAREHVFEPLTAEDEEEERIGWVSIEHPLDRELDEYKLFFNEYMNLSLRIDRWRIPSSLLKAYCVEAERKYMFENGKENLRRNEKEDVKAVVIAELKSKLLPAFKTIDVSWNTHTGIVRFWNQSSKTCEIFQDLFEKTFNVRLVPDNPYISALQFSLDDDLLTTLPDIEPNTFNRMDSELA